MKNKNNILSLSEETILWIGRIISFIVSPIFKIPVVLWEYYDDYRAWYFFTFFSKAQNERRHSEGVKRVQTQVLNWIANGRKNKMCTSRPGWMTMSVRNPAYKKQLTNIDVNLKDIVYLDKEKQILKVEPQVTMGVIYSVLLPTGWTLPVCPELTELTIGGLVMSIGIESSSHKYGLFNFIIESLEVVLPNGEAVICSKTENSDLFWGLYNSHGTIGFVTAIELKIIPCKKYVEMTYHPANSTDDYLDLYKKEIKNQDNLFVEGIVYSLDKAVIITGKMTQNINGSLNLINRWYKPLYYKYAQSFLKKGKTTEFVTLSDYYQRHRRGSFWMIEAFFDLGDNPYCLFFLGWVLPAKISFSKLVSPQYVQDIMNKITILQDYCIPLSKAKEMLTLSDKETKVYPIWLCPIDSKKFLADGSKINEEFYTDIGIYGNLPLKNVDPEKVAAKFEKFTLNNKGMLFPYADFQMSREDYSEMFQKDLFYDKIRKKYDCERAFPDVYNKICKNGREN